jgi:threonine dehydratase
MKVPPIPLPLPVTFDDVDHAARRLAGVAHRTPVLSSSTFNAVTGSSAFFKCENFQRTGAFKFRGAYNALSKLDSHSASRGVLSYSSGNHAQALALAGNLLGIATTIIMPSDAPAVKLEATKGYGAKIVVYDRSETTREALAEEIAATEELPVIPPYDHPDIVAGQGTVGLELTSDVPELDLLLICCGGGGLLSGCSIAARHLLPSIDIIGVEPQNADDATRSFYSGRLVTVHNPETIADGARTPCLGKITFPIVRSLVSDMVTVTEEAIIEAMRFLWGRMKIVVEPTGALAAAAALSGSLDLRGRRVGIVVSGGNVDLQQVAQWF